MKKSILSILLAVGLFPFASHADCQMLGHIVQVSATPDDIGTYHYIYLRKSLLYGNYVYVRTKDDDMAEIATTLFANGRRVWVRSDGTCPGDGDTTQPIGNLKWLVSY